MKPKLCCSEFHRSVILGSSWNKWVWFRYCLGAKQAAIYYFTNYVQAYCRTYASFGLGELTKKRITHIIVAAQTVQFKVPDHLRFGCIYISFLNLITKKTWNLNIIDHLREESTWNSNKSAFMA